MPSTRQRSKSEASPAGAPRLELTHMCRDLGVTSDDLLEAEEYAKGLSLDETYKVRQTPSRFSLYIIPGSLQILG